MQKWLFVTPVKLGRPFAISILAILTASCATTSSSAPTKEAATKVACQSFEPIYWSAKDTPKTVAQIKEHNAVGSKICPVWGKKK